MHKIIEFLLIQVPMNLFLMYMAGSSISIFPIMMVGMMLIRPIKALYGTNTTFKPIVMANSALHVSRTTLHYNIKIHFYVLLFAEIDLHIGKFG